MDPPLRVALVGDFDPAVLAHRAIPEALTLAGAAVGSAVDAEWVATDAISAEADLTAYDAIWCVPASPYRSMEGALRAIRMAREHRRPFLGTCGGFQHALIEYARSVLGWVDAEHAETAPSAERLVVTPLACTLVEAQALVRFLPGTKLATAYEAVTGMSEAVEGYRCRFGLNPAMRAALTAGPMRVAAEDAAGEVRAVELDAHPFFVATLFQPERSALRNEVPPIVCALLLAAASARTAR